MKLIPDAIGRKIAGQQLLASEHAPKLLFVGGVVGMVGSTVLACRATLKLEEVLDTIEHDKDQAHEVKRLVESDDYTGKETYTDGELRKDLAIISSRGLLSVAKLYAPAILVGGISVGMLTKSHNLLQERNAALAAAYVAVENAYSRYRDRVVERYGADADRELYYESEEIEVIDEETGKLVTTTRATDAPGSPYSRFFAEWSSRCWSPDPDLRMMFLINVQNWCNDKLKARGHLFLNEVYSELGLAHTRAGSQVGWRWGKGDGDDYVDLGIWDGLDGTIPDFFQGKEGEILLDFNVDGVIWNKIDETDQA